LGTGAKLRHVQWGSNVYVVANFDINAQNATLPSGTWYDYFAAGAKANSSVTLQPGEFRIYTGKQVELPTINLDLETLLPVANVSDNMPKAAKIYRDGQVLILRDGKIYNLQGQLLN